MRDGCAEGDDFGMTVPSQLLRDTNRSLSLLTPACEVHQTHKKKGCVSFCAVALAMPVKHVHGCAQMVTHTFLSFEMGMVTFRRSIRP